MFTAFSATTASWGIVANFGSPTSLMISFSDSPNSGSNRVITNLNFSRLPKWCFSGSIAFAVSTTAVHTGGTVTSTSLAASMAARCRGRVKSCPMSMTTKAYICRITSMIRRPIW